MDSDVVREVREIALSKEAKANLLTEAEKLIKKFGVDLTSYDGGRPMEDIKTGSRWVEWTLLSGRARLVVSDVHFDPATGELMTYGKNYGNLVL